MTDNTNIPTIEQTEIINAPAADIWRFLTDMDNLPGYWPEITLIDTDDSAARAYTPATGDRDD